MYQKGTWKMKRRRFGKAAILLVMVLTLVGCAAKSAGNYMAKDEEYYETTRAETSYGVAEEKTADSGGSGAAAEQAQKNAKIIYTTELDVQTEHYDEYLSGVYEALRAAGGHEQNSYIYNRTSGYRSAELYLRVPSDKRLEFIDSVSALGNVTSVRNTSRNITLNYIDTESRIEALRTEQSRLLELMQQADNMTDILAIEQRLTEVRYELQNYESVKNGYDYDVDYSTVTMYVTEVNREVVGNEQTLGGRLVKGFTGQLYRVSEFLQDLLVWLVSNFIFVILWVAAIFGVVKLFLALRRRARQNRDENGTSRRRRRGRKAEEAAAEAAAEPEAEKKAENE